MEPDDVFAISWLVVSFFFQGGADGLAVQANFKQVVLLLHFGAIQSISVFIGSLVWLVGGAQKTSCIVGEQVK